MSVHQHSPRGDRSRTPERLHTLVPRLHRTERGKMGHAAGDPQRIERRPPSRLFRRRCRLVHQAATRCRGLRSPPPSSWHRQGCLVAHLPRIVRSSLSAGGAAVKGGRRPAERTLESCIVSPLSPHNGIGRAPSGWPKCKDSPHAGGCVPCKDGSGRLGHADPRMTLAIYASAPCA